MKSILFCLFSTFVFSSMNVGLCNAIATTAVSHEQSKLEPFMDALFIEDLQAAQEIIDSGFDINQRLEDGTTILFFTVYFGAPSSVVNFLIESGADVNGQTLYTYTPLYASVFNTDYELTKILLESGANPNIKFTEIRDSQIRELTVLSLAKKYAQNYPETPKVQQLIKLLLSFGALEY